MSNSKSLILGYVKVLAERFIFRVEQPSAEFFFLRIVKKPPVQTRTAKVLCLGLCPFVVSFSRQNTLHCFSSPDWLMPVDKNGGEGLESDLGWTSIPPRGSKDNPGRLMLQKLEKLGQFKATVSSYFMLVSILQ